MQSEEDTESGMQNATPQESAEEQKNQSNQELHEALSQQEQSNEQRPQQILALGRSNFGRSLNPIQLPGGAEIQEAERADCKLNQICKFVSFQCKFPQLFSVVHPR